MLKERKKERYSETYDYTIWQIRVGVYMLYSSFPCHNLLFSAVDNGTTEYDDTQKAHHTMHFMYDVNF